MKATVTKIALFLLAILLIGACKSEKLEVPDPSRNKYFKGRNYSDVKEMKLGYTYYNEDGSLKPLRNLRINDEDKREIFKCLLDAYGLYPVEPHPGDQPKCRHMEGAIFVLDIDFWNGEGVLFKNTNCAYLRDMKTGNDVLDSELCPEIFNRHYMARQQRPDEGEAGPQRSLGDEARRRKVEAEEGMKNDKELRR